MQSNQRWVFVSIGLAFGACHCPVSAELQIRNSDGGDQLDDGGNLPGDGGQLGDGGNLGDGGSLGDGGQWDGGLIGDAGFVCLSNADCQQFVVASPADGGSLRLVCLGGSCQPDPCPIDYCDAGTCVPSCVSTRDPCQGIHCQADETCLDGTCVKGCFAADLCANVTCGKNQVCVPATGKCRNLEVCPGTDTCGPKSACTLTCVVPDACQDSACDAGQRCVLLPCDGGGDCHGGEEATCIANPCAGVVCPGTEVCSNGKCIETCCAMARLRLWRLRVRAVRVLRQIARQIPAARTTAAAMPVRHIVRDRQLPDAGRRWHRMLSAELRGRDLRHRRRLRRYLHLRDRDYLHRRQVLQPQLRGKAVR